MHIGGSNDHSFWHFRVGYNCLYLRIMARRDGAGVRLITRNGNDFASRFPFVVAAVTARPARSFLIDGEAIATNRDDLAVFDLIRHTRHGEAAVLCAFDLIEPDSEDLRRSSIEFRKRKLAKLVRGPHLGIVLNEHYEGDGEIVFRLQARLRGHRFEAARFALSLGALAALAEGQKSEGAGGQAGGRRGLGTLTNTRPSDRGIT